MDTPDMALWRKALDVGRKIDKLPLEAQRKAEEALLAAPSPPPVEELARAIGVPPRPA